MAGFEPARVVRLTGATVRRVYQFRHIPVSVRAYHVRSSASLAKVHTRAGFVFLPSASVSGECGASFLLIASHPFLACSASLVSLTDGLSEAVWRVAGSHPQRAFGKISVDSIARMFIMQTNPTTAKKAVKFTRHKFWVSESVRVTSSRRFPRLRSNFLDKKNLHKARMPAPLCISIHTGQGMNRKAVRADSTTKLMA
jgi:hypothetical protein